ncbi:uncharacterized protein LOC120001424 [Tripterygium wilfordii]|nr:uncharacterized protein LOC120001424 [Tripterygium wilfordii]
MPSADQFPLLDVPKNLTNITQYGLDDPSFSTHIVHCHLKFQKEWKFPTIYTVCHDLVQCNLYWLAMLLTLLVHQTLYKAWSNTKHFTQATLKDYTMAPSSFLISVLLSLAALHGAFAVEYVVDNRAANLPGGIKFNNEIGADYARQRMITASEFIWRLFQQNTEADRKTVARVTLVIDPDMKPGEVAYASNNEIHMGDDYINGIQGDARGDDFNGVLYHEMVHIWQWNGNGASGIGGLIEGIADFVRLKAGYVPSHWVKPGEGNSWNQGYDVTARFLDYCNDLRNGFVAELNKKMRTSYSDQFFADLLGKNVDQLWREYKAKYGM